MKRFTIMTLALLFLGVFAAAQVTTTGILSGVVTDEQGQALPGVAVIAESGRLVGQATTVTDATGTYRLFSLPGGIYSVRFTLQGFKTVTRRDVTVLIEQSLTLNITMEQATLEEEVTVVGQSPLIDVKSTTKGSTMTRDVFMQLPRNRDFTGLISTIPGVQYEGNQGGYSVDGASGGENMFYIDGTNINDVHKGYQQQSMVMEQVEEVKVTASGYTAEYGGSMGGVVNVISRSGGNTFHGDAYGYYNNNQLWMQGKDRDYLRRNPYVPAPYLAEYVNNDDLYFNGGKDRDDYQRFEGVFSLGGFIIKDRIWFFGSFNPIHSRTYADRFFTSDKGDTSIDPAVNPRQNRPVYGFYRKDWAYNGQAKITAAPFSGLRMSVSFVNNFTKYLGSIPNLDGTSSKDYPWVADWQNSLLNGSDPGFDYPNWSGNATIDYTVSNNFLVSLRGGWSHKNTTNQGVKSPGTIYYFPRTNVLAQWPEIPTNLQHYAGWMSWPGLYASAYVTKKWIQDRQSINLDLTYYLNLAGEHAWKAGVQFIRNSEDVDASSEHPVVILNWNTYYDWPDGTRIQGYYGNYQMRGSFISPYGAKWLIHSNAWSIYLQDSWTIGQKLTLNLGVRTESEYIPALTTDSSIPGYTPKPIQFDFGQKLAPRIGAIYDVFGDSSLKVFASFGIYYDVMKLYMAEGAYGGRKWWTSYWYLDTWDWTKIASNGKIDDKENQSAGGRYYGSRDWRHKSFGEETDPNMMPISQSEFTFGADKRISEEISFGARVVYKHLIRTIEDIGYLDAALNEAYVIGNPGMGAALQKKDGGLFSDDFWPCPKAKREYWGVNLSLEKRFSNNWQGGINYTWSQLKGNYGGLYSSDEAGRQGPNVDRYWDLYWERYDLHGKPYDGTLPSDRPHYLKVFGSYAFPFGLTLGAVGYGRSGLPRTTSIGFNDMTSFPDGYFDTGDRTPFLFTADLYAEYNIRIATKYTVQFNVTVYNFTNTKTITAYDDSPLMVQLRLTDAQILNQATNYVDWKTLTKNIESDPCYEKWSGRNGAWSMRFGARFSF